MVMKSSRRVKSVKKQRNVKKSRVSRKTSKSKVSKRKNGKTNRRKKRTKTKKKKHIMKGGGGEDGEYGIIDMSIEKKTQNTINIIRDDNTYLYDHTLWQYNLRNYPLRFCLLDSSNKTQMSIDDPAPIYKTMFSYYNDNLNLQSITKVSYKRNGEDDDELTTFTLPYKPIDVFETTSDVFETTSVPHHNILSIDKDEIEYELNTNFLYIKDKSKLSNSSTELCKIIDANLDTKLYPLYGYSKKYITENMGYNFGDLYIKISSTEYNNIWNLFNLIYSDMYNERLAQLKRTIILEEELLLEKKAYTSKLETKSKKKLNDAAHSFVKDEELELMERGFAQARIKLKSDHPYKIEYQIPASTENSLTLSFIIDENQLKTIQFQNMHRRITSKSSDVVLKRTSNYDYLDLPLQSITDKYLNNKEYIEKQMGTFIESYKSSLEFNYKVVSNDTEFHIHNDSEIGYFNKVTCTHPAFDIK
jgi:hypothetical protein